MAPNQNAVYAVEADALRRRLVLDPADFGRLSAFSSFALVNNWPPHRVHRLYRWYATLADHPEIGPRLMWLSRFPLGQKLRHSVLPPTRSVRSIDFGAGLSLRFADGHPVAGEFMRRVLPQDGVHEPELVEHLRRTVRPGDVVVDIGAHVGYVSCIAAALGAAVFAVELQPTLIPLIQLNAALNGLWTVHPICAAIGDSPGLASVSRISPSPGMQNSDGLVGQMVPAIGSLNHDWVPKLTLDGLFAEAPRPDLVKVDVEGAEGLVLAGAGRLIEAGETRFVIEVHSHLIERFGTHLEDLLAPFDAARWRLFELTIDGPRPLSRDAFLAPARGVEAGSENHLILFEPRVPPSGSD